MTSITVAVPDELAETARVQGWLEPQRLATIVCEALARVTVADMLKPGEPVKRPSQETVKALKAFHKGRRLDGITLRELREEGRR